jgi:manganese/zinc/iron transport system ATP- binding protein
VSAPALDVQDVTVAYQRRPVLWGVDLALSGPGLVAVVGPNGSGKSTLLKAALGLVPLAGGAITAFGLPAAQARDRLGYVPHRGGIDWGSPYSALDVVLMGTYGRLGWFRRPGPNERAWARECLARVGLSGLEGRPVGQLSAGQQARTFLARALAQQADLYLMDEPLADVDAATEAALVAVLRDLAARGKTLLVVHRDLRTVPAYFDQVVLLNMRVVAAGPTAEAFTTANLRRTFGGHLGPPDEPR